MLYKFKSSASGDVIMLAAHGDALLRVLGREPAPRGIIEVPAMALAIEQIQAAVQAAAATPDDPNRSNTANQANQANQANKANKADDGDQEPTVGLRQRWWPMLQMLQRSLAERVPIVWGV